MTYDLKYDVIVVSVGRSRVGGRDRFRPGRGEDPAGGRPFSGQLNAVLDTFYGFYTPGERSIKVVGDAV